MDWFKPNSETVALEAQFCLTIVNLFYVLSLKNKTANAYRVIGSSLFFGLQIIAFCLMTVGIYSSSFAIYEEWFGQLSQNGFFFYNLWFAYSFHKNIFQKESKYVLLGLAILNIICFYLWFRVFKVNQPQTQYNYLLYFIKGISVILLTIVVYIRKIRKTALAFNDRDQNAKVIQAYKGFLIADIFPFLGYISYLLMILHVVSVEANLYFYHIVSFFALTTYIFTYLNYCEERTSFQFKLVVVVLCVVLIILGLLPINLINNNAGINSSKDIHTFLILIPITTLLIVFLLPLLFRYVILKPLSQIFEGVKRVNDGDLTSYIKLGVNDEIGVLTQNFNRMTISLEQYSNKMNELVNERTSELNQSLQELKTTQDQLIQSEKLASLGELTAGIAHEIQNPLNFVNNFSEVSIEMLGEMEEELEKGDVKEASAIATDIKQNLEKIRHHGKRADGIVKGMLQHSRNNSGERQLTDLNVLADEYLRLSYHGLRAKDKSFNAALTTHFQENLPKLNIVSQDIGRVLLNLFNNAFYAVQQMQKTAGADYKPEVSVDTSFTDTFLVIKVKDNGTGIPEAVKDKIMQPFFTTKPTGEGTGLGLSLSYDIVVKGHGGKLDIDSEEGGYSEFLISLPIR